MAEFINLTASITKDCAEFNIMPAEKPIDVQELIDSRDTNAGKWAKAFLATHPNCGIDEGTMIGWFANAIMTMHDKLVYGDAPLNGDHAQYLKDLEASRQADIRSWLSDFDGISDEERAENEAIDVASTKAENGGAV